MRLAILAFGTRGDITPFVALGIRLKSEGHDVCLITHREFEAAARQHGLGFRQVAGSFQDFIATPEGRRALGVPRSSPLGMVGLFNPFLECAEAVYRDAWHATENAEGIISSAVASPAATLIAARRHVPLAVGFAIPSVPTRTMAHPAFPAWPLGGLYNRATYAAANLLVKRGPAVIFDRWRREADRLSISRAASPPKTIGLLAVSPVVVPRPADWPDYMHVTGYWWLPKGAAVPVPEPVRAFVEAGPPPICLGFGSMMDDNPGELRSIVLDALNRLRTRAVIVGGSGSALLGFENASEVCEVPFISYDWLFPRVSAVVHQGGAGTASFCLTAGVPQVVVKYCLDHTFWAARLTALGVAPPGLVRHKLTAAALAEAIRNAVDNPAYRRQAVLLAPRVAAEDGLASALALLQAHFGAA
jgi:UDP:flavonoid glycosyltransferase YjiC (YdhE family)